MGGNQHDGDGGTLRLWSVGHSTHSLDEFVSLLDAHGIRRIADIRKMPRSLRQPHFSIEALSQSLPAAGIDYSHLPGLGGFRPKTENSANDGWRNRSFRAYADYALTADFETALGELGELAAGQPTAMMCAEALWWRCHRRLIADQLVVRRGQVCHISSSTTTASRHEMTSFARIDCDGRITYPASR